MTQDRVYSETEVRQLEGLEGRWVVRLTLFLDAATAEEPADRAMQFRDAICGAPADIGANLSALPFDWYLHGPDGC